jgi:Mce-associated membrane protein
MDSAAGQPPGLRWLHAFRWQPGRGGQQGRDGQQGGGGQHVGRWQRDPLLVTAAALLVAAVAFAAWSGSSWLSAPRASGDAQIRDQALRAGEQAVLNFNTLDYRTVGKGVKLWEQSSTGSLHDEVVAGQAAFEQQIVQAKTVTTAKILDGALTGLNAQAGRASVIVALQITVTPATGSAATKQSRLAGQLIRTPSGWKLSALGQVPVGAAAAGSGAASGGGG